MEEQTSCESFALTQIYTGIVLTLTTTILMTIGAFFFVINIGVFQIGVETTFGFVGGSGMSVSNTLEVLFLLGWFPILSGIKKLDRGLAKFSSITMLYWCNILLLAAAFLDYFLIFNIIPESLFPAYTTVQIATVIPTLAIYPLQLAVIRKVANQVGNAKIKKQTHIWVWITPMLLVASITPVLAIHQNFFWILIVVLLVIAIQYWNMLEFLRRDIKGILLSSTEPLLLGQESKSKPGATA
ncbi:hypothetical protein COB72_11325 [bacterium]|nr:MAG: hypothetical protein COB72_11325 [bacterium]